MRMADGALIGLTQKSQAQMKHEQAAKITRNHTHKHKQYTVDQ